MSDKSNISITFKPTGSGLEKFFGPLEAAVIGIAWKHSPITIKRLLYFLNTDLNHQYAYTTVMTVMNRLVKKNILRRTKEGHSFVYTPLIKKADFLKYAVESILISLHTDYPAITNKAIKTIKD